MDRNDLYLSAIRGADGTVNVGYLVLFRSGRAVIIICSAMVIGAFVQAYFAEDHKFPLEELGKGIGLVLSAYGVLLAAIGAFLWGDSKQGQQASSTMTVTTTEGAK